MALTIEYNTLPIEGIPAFSARKKAEGWRFVQVLAVRTDDGADLVYTFMKNGILENTAVKNVTADDTVPSITDDFFAAFVFENEAHDLFGVNIEGIVIDFGGEFYALSQPEPMTIMSVEQKAARDKARAAAAAKKAKAGDEGAAPAGGGPAKAPLTDEEKAARREMALKIAAERKAAKEAAAKAAEVSEGGEA